MLYLALSLYRSISRSLPITIFFADTLYAKGSDPARDMRGRLGARFSTIPNANVIQNAMLARLLTAPNANAMLTRMSTTDQRRAT